METFKPMYGDKYKEDTGNEAIVDDLLAIEYVEWLENVIWEEAKLQKEYGNILIPFQKEYNFSPDIPNTPSTKIEMLSGNSEEFENFKNRFYKESTVSFSKKMDFNDPSAEISKQLTIPFDENDKG